MKLKSKGGRRRRSLRGVVEDKHIKGVNLVAVKEFQAFVRWSYFHVFSFYLFC